MKTAILFLKSPSSASQAQLEAGSYRKQHRKFQGLDITIENPAGSVRQGIDRDGHKWRTKMIYAYGYIRGSLGVDGDHVDCYIGPDEEADTAYIVHQRKAGQWNRFDEDKVMLGFPSEEAAKRAYLKHYDDPRFLGPVTAMPMAEFKEKVLSTREKPRMIKAASVAIFFKSYVRAHTRRLKSGKIVQVGSYHTDVRAMARVGRAKGDIRTGDLFGDHRQLEQPSPKEPSHEAAKPSYMRPFQAEYPLFGTMTVVPGNGVSVPEGHTAVRSEYVELTRKIPHKYLDDYRFTPADKHYRVSVIKNPEGGMYAFVEYPAAYEHKGKQLVVDFAPLDPGAHTNIPALQKIENVAIRMQKEESGRSEQLL